MAKVARKSGVDSVNTVHVSVGDAVPDDGCICDAAPQTVGTNGGSANVFANGTGVVRSGDAVQAHTFPCACATHSPGLASFSGTVFANGKGMGRLGDNYGCGATITSGSSDVYAGG